MLCNGQEFEKKLKIDPTVIAQKVCSEIFDTVKTTMLDELSSETGLFLCILKILIMLL